jgi:thymidylate synthase (FAD)
MQVELVWATPNGEQLIAEMARVSNPTNAKNTETAPNLIKYLIEHSHWSPFEMVNVCMSIKCPRDISRQLLRHRSFTFQEFSQRYAKVDSNFIPRDIRLQDTANRQNSISINPHTEDKEELLAVHDWYETQKRIHNITKSEYERQLSRGVAKEVARTLLPEGLTPTHLYMNGTLRSWIHFCGVRLGEETQKETRQVAQMIEDIVKPLFPVSWRL